MNILLYSALGFAINQSTRYAGIERLVWEFSLELVKQGQTVTVIGHKDSIYPHGVTHLPHISSSSIDAEIPTFQRYAPLLRKFDVIHDFSHLHLASRFMANLPSLNIFWHAPALAQYPKAPYNIIALSQWAAREFERVYHQKARYQPSIVIDTELYKPSDTSRNDRFFALGRMGPEKGNLAAVLLCLKAGVPLDIQGARGLENAPGSPLTKYEQDVLSLCDGQNIRYLGDLPEPEKIKMMQSNKALLYATDHPEVTSHKIQECMLAGMPVIVPNIGALPEIVTQGVNGFLCRNDEEYLEAIQNVGQLRPMDAYAGVVEMWKRENVVKRYLPLYESVAGGTRW